MERRHRWMQSCMGGMVALLLFLAIDNVATSYSMTRTSSSLSMKESHSSVTFVSDNHNNHNNHDITNNNHRRLEDEQSWNEIVQDAIQDSMESGEIGANNSKIVGVTYVPLDELPPPRNDTRDIDPPDNDDDGLDRIWIIVMIVAGVVVLCLIGVAYMCLRKAEQEDEDDSDAEEDDGDEQNDKEQGRQTEDAEDDLSHNNNVLPEQALSSEKDQELGQFQVSSDDNVEYGDSSS